MVEAVEKLWCEALSGVRYLWEQTFHRRFWLMPRRFLVPWLVFRCSGHGSGDLWDEGRRLPGMLGKPFQVLHGGGQMELVPGTREAT